MMQYSADFVQSRRSARSALRHVPILREIIAGETIRFYMPSIRRRVVADANPGRINTLCTPPARRSGNPPASAARALPCIHAAGDGRRPC